MHAGQANTAKQRSADATPMSTNGTNGTKTDRDHGALEKHYSHAWAEGYKQGRQDGMVDAQRHYKPLLLNARLHSAAYAIFALTIAGIIAFA